MDQSNKILIALVRSGITGEPLTEQIKATINEESLKGVYDAARVHALTHLAAHGLYKNGLLTAQDGICGQFRQSNLVAILRHETMQHEIGRMYALFEECAIPFLPLKGAVIRGYYPEPWMRTSGDVDILVHPEDLERAIEALCSKLGYTLKSRDSYDVSLYSPSGVYLELHFALMEKRFEASRYLETVWQNATPVAQGSFRYAMTDDLFYFHQVVHLAKHFVTSGCGIRLFMDLWVLNHHKDFRPTGICADYLKDVGLVKLEEQARALSEVWFSGENHSALSAQVEDYVLDSGIYGTVKNAVTTGQLHTGGKGSYILSRIFLPYDRIREYYPILHEKKYLTPVYQVKRWLSVIGEGRLRRSAREFTTSMQTEPDLRDNIRDMMTKLELY